MWSGGQIIQETLLVQGPLNHCITYNPNWAEITHELLPGQTVADRPDLCARVFHMKKKVIIEIYKKGIFGKAVAYIYTIKFQKCGLPHIHILIFLKDGEKIITPADIDTAIQAYHMVQLLFPLCCWFIHLHKMPVLLGLTLTYIRCTLQLYWGTK